MRKTEGGCMCEKLCLIYIYIYRGKESVLVTVFDSEKVRERE